MCQSLILFLLREVSVRATAVPVSRPASWLLRPRFSSLTRVLCACWNHCADVEVPCFFSICMLCDVLGIRFLSACAIGVFLSVRPFSVLALWGCGARGCCAVLCIKLCCDLVLICLCVRPYDCLSLWPTTSCPCGRPYVACPCFRPHLRCSHLDPCVCPVSMLALCRVCVARVVGSGNA